MDAGTQWRGQLDTKRRRLIAWLIVSFLLHTPLTPLAGLLSFLSFLGQPPAPPVTEKPLTEIPIDLLETEDSSEGEQKPKAEEPKPVAELPPAPEPVVLAPRVKEVPDAGAARESEDGGADAAAAGLDAGLDGGGTLPGQDIGDPLAVASGTKRIVDPNANIKLTIYTERIRNQPLGKRIGPVLGSVYQWRDFFGPAGIDPIRDIDQITVVGSQLRDSSGVIAILRHNVGNERMKKALESLAARDPSGGWLDAGVAAVSARADRAERIIALNPPDHVVVVPPTAKDALFRSIKAIRLRPSTGTEVLNVYVATPWRTLIGVRSPIQVPQSIKWARAKVTPTPDGGAYIEIAALDENLETAEKNAQQLTEAINAATMLKGMWAGLLGMSGQRLLEPVSFHAQFRMIYGSARVTPKQLETALTFVEAFLTDSRRRPAPAPGTVSSGQVPPP